MKKLSFEDVILIRQLMKNTGIAELSSFGEVKPINNDKLHSAVGRQNTSIGGVFKYNTLEDVAATLFYGITMNHAFENGNKRTAVVCLLIFLDRNKKFLINVREDDIYELARKVASHEMVKNKDKYTADDEVEAISKWVLDRTRSKVLGEKPMEFPELKNILENFGCTFESPFRNFIKIRRDKYSVSTGYPKRKFDVSIKEIKRIRRLLHLSEVDGVDSSGFYNYETRVTSFVNKYRNLMRRLADL